MTKRLPAARGLLLASFFVACTSAAHAEPRLGQLFADHAVLQRGRPIPVWGTADPGERIAVALGEARLTVTAGRDGAWRVELPAMGAGGPYVLSASSPSGTATARDVLVGDVWLCSGQSNMELQVSRSLNGHNDTQAANDPQLRLLTVPRSASAEPASGFESPVAWRPAAPESVGDFSAACYHMVRELRRSENVPMGAIAASWGGTPVQSWMDEAGARAAAGEDYRLFALHRTDPAGANRAFGERWGEWWRNSSGDAAGQEPWRASDRLQWSPVPRMTFWDQWGILDLADFDGMLWFRKRVTLTEQEARQSGTLSLGVMDDLDQTFVNGVSVGGLHSWDRARDYPVPAGLLRAGENEIVVAVLDSYGPGGMAGPSGALRLTLADGTVKPIGDGWEYSVVRELGPWPPTAPWDAPMGLTFLYNGMIAPLRDYGVSGVAWYQGEADVGRPGSYADRLAAMMADWRRQFGRPDLPFFIVGLANYGPFATRPVESGWADLRQQQRLAAARDPRAALVVAMDLGERLDIHPANKTELGRRLARAARSLVYGAAAPVGPEIARARRAPEGIVLEFTGVIGSLHTWSGTRALAFELCAETQESCRYADAVGSGSSVRLADDGRPATRVRYAWADSPVTNLYDEAPLPIGPFEAPIE